MFYNHVLCPGKSKWDQNFLAEAEKPMVETQHCSISFHGAGSLILNATIVITLWLLVDDDLQAEMQLLYSIA